MKINLKKVVGTTLWIMLLSQSVIWPMTNITYAAPIHSRSNFSQSEDWAITSFDLLNIPWKTWDFNDSNFWNYWRRAGYSIRTQWLTSNVVDGWVSVTAKSPIIDNNKRYKLHKIDLEWSLNVPSYQWRWSNIMQTGFDIQQDLVLQVFVHWSSWLSYNWRSLSDPVSKLLEYNGSWFNKTKLYTLPSTAWNTMKEPFAMFKYRNLNWERVGLFFTLPWDTWTKNFKFTLDWTRGKFEFGWIVYDFDISDKDFQPWYTITNTNSFLHHQSNATSYTIGFDLTKFNVDLQELGSIKITSEIASDLSKNDVDVYLFGKKQTTPITNNKKINTIYASNWLDLKSVNQLVDNGYIIASNQADVKGNVSNADLNAYVLNADLSTAWPTRKPWMRGFYDNQGSFQPESTAYDCQWFDGTFNIPWKTPTSVTCPSNYSTIWGIGIEQAYFPWLNQSPRIHKNSSNQYYIAWYIQSQRHVATTTMDYLNYRVLPSSNSAILFFSWGYYFINNINQYSWSTIASNSTMNFGDIEWYIRDWKAWTNTYQFFTKKSNDEIQVNVFDLTKLPNAWNPNQHLKETIILWSNQSFNLPWLKAINGFGELIYTLQETGWKVKVSLWKLKSDLKEKPELLDEKEYSWMTTTGKNFIKQNAFYFGLENPSTNKTQIQGVWYIDLSQTKISKEENCDETKTYEAFAPSSFTSQNDNGKKMCYRVLDVYGNYKYVASPVISGLWPKQIRVKLNENLYDKNPASFPKTQPEYYYKSYKLGVSFEDNKTYPDKLKVKSKEISKTSTCNATILSTGTTDFEIEQNVDRKYEINNQSQNQNKLCFWVENVYWETHYEEIEYPNKVDTTNPTYTQNVAFYSEMTRNVFVWDEVDPVIKYINTVSDNYRTDLDKTKYEFIGWHAGLCTHDTTSKKITCSRPWTYTYVLKYYDYALNELSFPWLTLKVHANDRSEIRTKYNLAKADVDDTKTIHNTDYTNLKTYIESSEIQEAIKTSSATADKLTKAQITTIKDKIANLNSKIIKDTTKPTGTISVSTTGNPYTVSWVTTYYTKETPVVANLTTSEPVKNITWWIKTDTEGKKWKKEWTANATFIKDQSLSFEDLYGNVVVTAPTYSIPVIDTTVPTLTITNPNLETKVGVAITNSTIDGNYTYSDDKTSVSITKAWVGNNPWTYDTVGTYTLKVTAKDIAGNTTVKNITIKVKEVDKTNLVSKLNTLKSKLENSKVVKNSNYTTAKNWYDTNKTKGTETNLTENEMNQLITTINNHISSLTLDTTLPNKTITYSSNWSNYTKASNPKKIDFEFSDIDAGVKTVKHVLDNNTICDATLVSQMSDTTVTQTWTNPVVHKWTLSFNEETDNGKSVCFRVEDKVGNVLYHRSNQITKIDTTKPVINLTKTTETIKVGSQSAYNLRGIIQSATDTIETSINDSNVVVKNITDPSTPTIANSLLNPNVWTYKFEYSLSDTAWNEAVKKVFTLKVIENDKSSLHTILTTINQKLADSKLIHNTHKTNLENYKTTINNAISNVNISENDINDIITEATSRINKLEFDTVAPTLTFDTLTPNINVGETFNKFHGLTTTDNVDTTTSQVDWNNKTTVTSSPALNTNQVWTYTLTYKVKDNHNNEATYVRTVKVIENDKTNLNTAISSAETVLNNVKTVRDSHYTTLKNYITALKNDNDKVLKNVNATQTQITNVINQINTYKTALSSDTTKPTISFTYSSDFSQLAKSKWIGFSATDNVATNVKVSYLTTNTTDNCSTLTYPSPETTRKVTYQLEANNNQKLCVKAEDDNQNIVYLGSNEIKKIDRTAPVINLTETTKTFKVWVHTTLNLKNNITSVTDNLETALNVNNVVIKNITDTSHPITTSTLNNIQVGTYKVEYSLTDTAWNEATKKIYTITVQENDKTDLNNLITTINTKLSNPKLVNNSAKTDLESYKTTITNAIANRNITQAQIDTIKSNAQTKINALVFDTTAPTMNFDTLTPSIKVWEVFNYFQGLTTTDNIDTSTTQEQWNTKTTVTSNPTLNTNQVWTYTLTYKVKDEHNNEATSTRTLKVNPVNKTWLTTKLNDLKAKLEHNKTVHNNAFNDATTWYNSNKTKDTEQNLTQTEMNQLITKINQLVNSLSTDTTSPTITLKTQELTTKVGETINTSKANLIGKYIQSVTDDFTVFDDTKINTNTTFYTTEIWAIDFNTVGTYTFHFTTRDDNGNATTKEVKIKVNPIDKTNLTNKLVELKNKLDNAKTIVDNKHTIATTWYNANKTKKDDVNLTQTQANQLITKIDELLSTLTTDNQKPVISGLNKLTFDLWTTPPVNYKTTGVSVSDNNPALTPTILKTRLVIDDTAVNFNQVGMYNIKYEVTDDNGNKTIQNRVVEIKTLDKTQANQCIAQLETFRETNNDTILPSLRTIINNLINSKRAITSNVNANRTQVDSVCHDINNFINNFDTNYPKPILTSSRSNIEVFVWNTPIYTWIVTANDPTDWNLTSHIVIDHSNINVTEIGNHIAKYSVSNSKWRKTTFNLPIKVKAHSSGSSSTSGWGSDNVVFNTQKYWVQKQETKVVDTKKVENIETKTNKVSSDKNNSRELLENHIKTKKDKTTTKKSNFQDKQHEEAYNWAIKNKIIDKKTFPSSWIYNHLTRWELAVIVANFSKKLNKDKKFTKEQCSKFEDLNSVNNPVIKDWMIRACEYGLMGIHSDGKTQIKDFMNTKTLRRADLATVVSRMLWGTKYDDVKLKDKYWYKHLKHLSEEKIIQIPDPEIKEIKQWILLMLKRYDK